MISVTDDTLLHQESKRADAAEKILITLGHYLVDNGLVVREHFQIWEGDEK